MGRRPLSAVIVAICSLSLAGSAGLVRAEFEAETGWNGHLFPSFIVATATVKLPAADDEEEDDVLGDPKGLLGVTVEAGEDDQPIKVTITCDAVMEPSVFSGTLATKGESYTINPKIKYKFDQLAKRTQTGPVTVTFKVELGDDEAEEQTETLTLRSINDCPFWMTDEDGTTDLSFMFAAYVNEQHPFVDKLLREALNTEIVGSFTGYQSKNKAEVLRQVYSLWSALSARDVRYSNITTSAAETDTVGSQHVRLIDESINNGQANCVDGSVLMASLMRKVGIEPMLILVPGHCYLAFQLDREGKEISALETTLIGSSIEKAAIKVDVLEGVVGADSLDENSWKTFSAAIATGTANFKKDIDKFKDAKQHNYKVISVAGARKLGILPISFQSNQKLNAAP